MSCFSNEIVETNTWVDAQLVNHGVSSSVLGNLKHEIVEFYKLPLEQKMKYKTPGDVEGYGPSIIRSEDQKLDWGDRFYMITNPIHNRKPHLLPQLPPSLRFSRSFFFRHVWFMFLKTALENYFLKHVEHQKHICFFVFSDLVI